MAIKPYDHTTYPSNGALGSSVALRNELDAIEAGFDMVATEIETALTGSETAAATATTQAGIATTQAEIATTQAGLSATQAGISTTQAGISTTQAEIATTQAANALASANSAAATLDTVNTVYDNFDDRYLGAKAVEPTLDNDGNALQVGALYWDSVLNTLRGYNGAAWVDLPATTAASMTSTPSGNLAATNVQAALNELQSDVDTRELSINAASAKVTPVDADLLGLIDSAATFALKKLTLANFKDFLFVSPALTGTPSLPTGATAVTQTAGDNTTKIATTAFVLANAPVAFPAGTRMTFNQTAAPTGWTKDTTAALNDSIMRIVTGSVVGGGVTAFTTFNAQTSVGATTLSTAQVPSQTYQGYGITGGTVSSGGSPSVGMGYISSTGNSVGWANIKAAASQGGFRDTNGGGSHTHSITTNIKYNDFIIAEKD